MIVITLANNQKLTEEQCSWSQLSFIPIKYIEYYLWNGKKIRLSGFERYLVLKEYYSFVNYKSKELLDTVNLLAKYANIVYQVSINVRKKRILQVKNVWGEEFASLQYDTKLKDFKFGKARRTNYSQWKLGVVNNTPIARIMNKND